jgi:hypothetical protein
VTRDLFRPYARSISLALGGGVILVGALAAVSLVIYARCKTEADCADAVIIARSLELL